MEYLPLSFKEGEIRVITIVVGKDDFFPANGPVRCTLEHVKLDEESRADAYKSAKSAEGAERKWPEAYTEVDTKPLWNDKKLDSGATSSKLPDMGLDDVNVDGRLAWRFVWGDYVALSYCWGDAGTTREIIVNGYSVHVTVNLEAALRQLRDSHRIKQGLKLWVDAICIDQSNLEERGQQVGRMRDIYASAWHVVIWLGVDANDSSLAMTAIRYISARMGTEGPLSELYRTSKAIDARPFFIIWSTYKSSIRKEVYRALYHLLVRPYWRRLWILQEVALGEQDSPVLCGTKCVLWRDIYNFSRSIELDENRFGRDIIASVNPRILNAWSWEFARDRVPYNSGLETSSEFLWKIPLSLTTLQQEQHSSSTNSSTDATKLFNLSLGAKATDQKDRVFGILGIALISSLTDIKPDYHLSLEQVYVDFTKTLIARGVLNILRLAQSPIAEIDSRPPPNTIPPALDYPILEPLVTYVYTKGKRQTVALDCIHNLPSWTVCWACPRGPIAQLLGNYCVDGGECESSTVFKSDRVLKVRGMIFDTVNSLSSFHTRESNIKFPFNGKPCSSFYGDNTATREALWRTLVGDTTRDGAWAPESYSLLLKPEIWEDGVAGAKNNKFGLHEFMARNARLCVLGSTLKELVLGTSRFFSNRHRKLYNPTDTESEAISWAMNAMAWRRLMTTNHGYLGLAVAATEPDDRICILAGCNTPLILRPRGGYFRIIGECYVHGIMRGETVKDKRKGRLQMDEILLC